MSIADKLKTIAENEQKVNDKGYLDGWREGYKHKTFSDRFWELYQDGGNRRDYSGAFMSWAAGQYSPKYPVIVENGSQCFRQFNNLGYNGRNYDPNFYMSTPPDFSKATNVADCFFTAVIKRVGELDFSNAIYAERSFYYSEIVTIDKLVFPSEADISNMFSGAQLLTNITIQGTIKQNGLDLSWCNLLTRKSLLSFLNALEDKSGDKSGTTWTFIMGGTNLTKLSAADKNIATAKGWTLK